MLKMVDGTGIIGVDMVCPLGGAVSPPQPPNYDKVEMEGVGSLMLPNSLKAPLERLELIGNSVQPTTTGKNLFDPKQLQGISGFTIEGNEITQSGYNVSTGKTLKQLCPEITPGTYILSANNGDFTGLFGITKPVYKKSAIEIVDEDLNRIVALVGNPNKTIKYTLQIEKGNTVTPYEPYTGGKPSPSPEYPQEIKNSGKWNEEKQKYEIDVKVTGKNLFDREKARDITNWIVRENDSNAKFPIRVGEGNKVTFSYTEKLTAGKEFYLGITQSETSAVVAWLYRSAGTNLYNNKHTVVAAGDYIYLSCDKSGIQKFVDTIQTLQVEIGSEQTEYEPYTEQALTLASDRPLTKWDKLVEQGGQYGWLYNSKHMLLNGSEDWVKSSINNVFYLKSFEGLPNSYEIFCDKLKNFRGAVNAIELNCILGNRTNLYICIDGITDIGTLKTWLSENNLEVYYNSKESQFVPLPESEQTQLRNLHSYNGTTHINIDSGEVPCGIKLTYRKEN